MNLEIHERVSRRNPGSTRRFQRGEISSRLVFVSSGSVGGRQKPLQHENASPEVPPLRLLHREAREVLAAASDLSTPLQGSSVSCQLSG